MGIAEPEDIAECLIVVNVNYVIHGLIAMKRERLWMILLFAKIVWIEWKKNNTA